MNQPRADRDSGGVSLFTLVAVLLRHRATVVAVTLATVLSVLGYKLVSDATWTADISFMPQSSGAAGAGQLMDLAGQFGFNLPQAEAGQSPDFYATLVRSDEILYPIAGAEYRIARRPRDPGSDTIVSDLAALLEVEAEQPDLVTKEVVEWLRRKALGVRVDDAAGLVEVTVKTPWPSVSHEVAGTIVRLVNEFNLERRRSQAAEERRFAQERMEEMREELQAAENALQSFLQSNRLFQDSPELVFEHERLQRQVVMAQQLYTSLAQAYEQARINEVRNTPVITVVEQPRVPPEPDPRRWASTGVFALLLGGVLGSFAALGRELVLRRRQEGAADVTELAAAWFDTKRSFRALFRP